MAKKGESDPLDGVQQAEEVKPDGGENPSTSDEETATIEHVENGMTEDEAAEAAAAAARAAEESAPAKPKRGQVLVKYIGGAHVARVGQYRLEPGVPAAVPKGIAEVLLSHPSEEFVVVDETGTTQGEE